MKNTVKRIASLSLAALLTLSLTACGGTSSGSSSAADSGQPTVLKVGASPSPHAAILESVSAQLAEQGITLQIEEFTDYVLPNTALDEGSLDANYFQHQPYLTLFNEEHNTNIVSAGSIHFEPMGVYAGKSSDLANVPDGATIAVPNDGTNEARALQLLAAQGLIKLAEDAGLKATPLDIIENPKNLQFTEIEAAQLPRILGDVDFAVINGNYAIDGGVTEKILVSETADSQGAQEFANIIAVRSGDESRPEIQALIAALNSDETKAFIAEQFGDYVVSISK